MLNGELHSLDKIIQNYSPILIDTSVFLGSLNHGDYINAKTEKKIKVVEENHFFRDKIFEYLDSNQELFITESVSEEYRKRSPFNYKKKVKSLDKFVRFQLDPNLDRREELKLLRLRKKFKRERRALAIYFKEKNKLLDLNESQRESYKFIFRKYEKCMKRNKLSSADKELVISAFILSEFDKSPALLSNDFGIISTRNFISSKEYNFNNIFPIFVRENKDKFHKL